MSWIAAEYFNDDAQGLLPIWFRPEDVMVVMVDIDSPPGDYYTVYFSGGIEEAFAIPQKYLTDIITNKLLNVVPPIPSTPTF